MASRFRLTSSSYDFASKRINVVIQFTEPGQFGAISINVPFAIPNGLISDHVEPFVEEEVRRILSAAALFESSKNG